VNKTKVALFIIDMQKDFVLPESASCIAGAKATIPSIVSILNIFRDIGLPVFHIVREYREDGSDIEKFRFKEFTEKTKYAVPNTSGCEIVDELKPKDNEYRIIKNRFSGFMNTELDFMLRRLEISKIIITGTQYPNCIRATVFDAVALGYDVTVITDATSAATEEVAKANIIDLQNIGINCIKSNELEI
jgi:nicotinamidase-related amidase